MQDNPFAEMITMMRNEGGGTGLQLLEGKVISLTPFIIQASSLRLQLKHLRFNVSLTGYDYGQRVPSFEIGDEVLLLTLDEQLFYVVCKVVTI